MTDTSPGIEDPTPFAPRSAVTLPAGRVRRRLIGCGAALAVLALVVLVAVWKAPDLFRWSMERVEQEVNAALPEEVGPAERRRLERAFDDAREAVLAGRARAGDLSRLKEELDRLNERGLENLSGEDVARLTAALERVAAAADDGPALEGNVGRDVPLWIAVPVHSAG